MILQTKNVAFFGDAPNKRKRNSGYLQKGCIPNRMQVTCHAIFLPSGAFIFDKLNASPNGMQKTKM